MDESGGLQAFLLGCKAGGPFLHELPQKRTSCGAFVARAEAMVPRQQAAEMLALSSLSSCFCSLSAGVVFSSSVTGGAICGSCRKCTSRGR